MRRLYATRMPTKFIGHAEIKPKNPMMIAEKQMSTTIAIDVPVSSAPPSPPPRFIPMAKRSIEKGSKGFTGVPTVKL